MRIFQKPGLVAQVLTEAEKTIIWFMIFPNPTSIIHPAKCESNINAPTASWIITVCHPHNSGTGFRHTAEISGDEQSESCQQDHFIWMFFLVLIIFFYLSPPGFGLDFSVEVPISCQIFSLSALWYLLEWCYYSEDGHIWKDWRLHRLAFQIGSQYVTRRAFTCCEATSINASYCLQYVLKTAGETLHH